MLNLQIAQAVNRGMEPAQRVRLTLGICMDHTCGICVGGDGLQRKITVTKYVEHRVPHHVLVRKQSIDGHILLAHNLNPTKGSVLSTAVGKI